jgi:hypothetical protein
MCISQLPHVWCSSRIFHPSKFDNPNNSWWRCTSSSLLIFSILPLFRLSLSLSLWAHYAKKYRYWTISWQPLNIVQQGTVTSGHEAETQEMHYFSYSNFTSHYIPSSFTIQLHTMACFSRGNRQCAAKFYFPVWKYMIIISLCFVSVRCTIFPLLILLLLSSSSSSIHQVQYGHANVWGYLNFHTLCARRCHLNALFCINIYSGSKSWTSVLETVGIRVPARNIRDFPLFKLLKHSSTYCYMRIRC